VAQKLSPGPVVPGSFRDKLGQAARALGARRENTPPSGPIATKLAEGFRGGLQTMGNKVNDYAMEHSPRLREADLDRRIAQAQEQLGRKPVDGGEL